MSTIDLSSSWACPPLAALPPAPPALPVPRDSGAGPARGDPGDSACADRASGASRARRARSRFGRPRRDSETAPPGEGSPGTGTRSGLGPLRTGTGAAGTGRLATLADAIRRAPKQTRIRGLPLEDLGVETLRVHRAKGRSEAWLRLRVGDATLEARILETRSAVEIQLTGPTDPALLGRIVAALQSRGHVVEASSTGQAPPPPGSGSPFDAATGGGAEDARDQASDESLEADRSDDAPRTTARIAPRQAAAQLRATSMLHTARAVAVAVTRGRIQGMLEQQDQPKPVGQPLIERPGTPGPSARAARETC